MLIAGECARLPTSCCPMASASNAPNISSPHGSAKSSHVLQWFQLIPIWAFLLHWAVEGLWQQWRSALQPSLGMKHGKRYEYFPPKVLVHTRLHQCNELHNRGHKIMASIFPFPFPSMKIVGMAGTGDRPNPLLQNSSPFYVCRRTSSANFVPSVGFPSSISVCPVPFEASPSPLVCDYHPKKFVDEGEGFIPV